MATDPPTTTTPLSAPAAAQPTSASTALGGDDQTLFSKFDIPQFVRDTYPDLIPLILQTESMNDDERQYWFQMLPIMTEEQVVKLREILFNEKNQLANLDKQYNKQVKTINDSHVAEWKEFEVKEKREKLKAEENKTKSSETEQQENLLSQLNSL